ncbi:MAG: hypothetical protein PSY14_07730 [bacterium]|nr:hypothetical protein [bacterium]
MQAQQHSQSQKPTRITLDNAGVEALGKNVSISFRPIWNVEKKYLCGYLVRRVGAAPKTQDGAAAADLGLLVKAAESLERLQAQGEKSVVVVPVGYETLNAYPFRGHYLSLLRRIPEALRSYIVLQLDNIPQHASKQRLQLLQTDMRGLCRAVALTSDIRGANLDSVSRGNLHACVVDFSDASIGEDTMVSLINRFADKVGGINCAAMADGVSTRAALCAAISAGFRYIAGEAVVADQPELGISRRHFSIEDAFNPS